MLAHSQRICPPHRSTCQSQPITRLACANVCQENILCIVLATALVRSISSYILYSRRRQEQEIKIMRRNFEYFNSLLQYWGIHLQDEYNPQDSSTVADLDDDIKSPSSGASLSPLSLTLPSSHDQPQSNSSETLQCATTRSNRAMETPGTSRLFKRRKHNKSGNQSCLAHSVWSILTDEHRTDKFLSELEICPKRENRP